MLTQERLKELLHYDPETGLFTWIITPGRRIKAGSIAGTITNKGYIHIIYKGKINQAHRLAWLYMTGEWPKGQIDHKDTVRSNNIWDNLREATNTQNAHNRKNQTNRSSKYKGVSRTSSGNAWIAKIGVNNKAIYLGTFTSEEEAHVTYCKAADKHFGKYANYGN